MVFLCATVCLPLPFLSLSTAGDRFKVPELSRTAIPSSTLATCGKDALLRLYSLRCSIPHVLPIAPLPSIRFKPLPQNGLRLQTQGLDSI